MKPQVEFSRHTPCGKLQPFINCYWFYEVGPTEHDFNIMPDGYIDVISFAGRDYESILTGIWKTSSILKFSDVFITGIQLKPQFLCLKNLGVNNLVDSYRPFDLKELGIRKEDLQSFRKDKESIIAYLDRSLLSLITTGGLNTACFDVFELLDSKSCEMSIEKIAVHGGVSPRTISRYVKNLLGINAKSYVNIVRFRQAMMGRADELSPGFHDQSHFIKQVKRLTDQTPGQLSRDPVRNIQYMNTPD